MQLSKIAQTYAGALGDSLGIVGGDGVWQDGGFNGDLGKYFSVRCCLGVVVDLIDNGAACGDCGGSLMLLCISLKIVINLEEFIDSNCCLLKS